MNPSCDTLLRQIYEVSFAMDDVTLYLDTHPTDREALEYYRYVASLRKQAIDAYEAQCGPMLLDGEQSADYWTWINDKWPWEGGCD